MGVVVPKREVLNAAVVPEGNGMRAPAETTLESGRGDVPVQELEHGLTLSRLETDDTGGKRTRSRTALCHPSLGVRTPPDALLWDRRPHANPPRSHRRSQSGFAESHATRLNRRAIASWALRVRQTRRTCLKTRCPHRSGGTSCKCKMLPKGGSGSLETSECHFLPA